MHKEYLLDPQAKRLKSGCQTDVSSAIHTGKAMPLSQRTEKPTHQKPFFLTFAGPPNEQPEINGSS